MDDRDTVLSTFSVVSICYCTHLLLTLIRKSDRRPKPRTQWVRNFLKTRNTEGAYTLLSPRLISDKCHFRNYFRMSQETFQYLLSLVGPHITQMNTIMRESISPHERLAVTLRFLATGKTREFF